MWFHLAVNLDPTALMLMRNDSVKDDAIGDE